jgi:outer membrane protein TolC
MRATTRRASVFGGLVLSTALACATADAASPYPVDLPTVLRLVDAQNLDVQLARQALAQAKAEHLSALEQFLPSVAVGSTYQQRVGLAQAVPAGTISATNYYSYATGGTLTAQVALGDALYAALAARQLVHASDQALAAQRDDAVLAAAQGYFELQKAKALAEVAAQAVRTSEDYGRQIHEAVAVGIAFKGDELRVQTQTEQFRIALRQAGEQAAVASARLAQVLHLEAAVELVPQDPGPIPIRLFAPETTAEELIGRAQAARPELKRSQALVAAAEDAKNGAVYGPMVPTLGAQVFAGALGGGHVDEPSNFGDSEQYVVGLSWRLGPGGLLDLGRIGASEARLAAARLNDAKTKDAVGTQVVEALGRIRSLSEQMALSERNVASADETLRLTRARKQFGVGLVLEDIQAQEALVRARSDYVASVAEFDQAQYALARAVGGPPGSSAEVDAGRAADHPGRAVQATAVPTPPAPR